jgi:hypothetical protein
MQSPRLLLGVLSSLGAAALLACGGQLEPAGPTAAVAPLPAAAAHLGALRAVGQACAFAWQCASGSCSADVASGGCGVCRDVRRLGQRCDEPLATCSATATCSSSRGATCVSTKKVLDQPCALGGLGDSQDCDDDLYCEGTPGGTGTCKAKPAQGEACSLDQPFAVCVGGGNCERGTCAARRLGAAGDSCDQRTCDEGLACEHGACQRPTAIATGAPCGVSPGLTCEVGARCELTGGPADASGHSPMACLPGRTEGQECASNHCAEGLFCDPPAPGAPSRCQRLRSEGEACRLDDSCAASLECRQGRCQVACR